MMNIIWIIFILVCLLIRFCNGFHPYSTRLSIDYGPKQIGIAYSNILGQVNPITTIQNDRNQTLVCHKILMYAKRENVDEILVGIPLDSNGILSYQIRNFNGRLCLQFASVLSAVAGHVKPNIKVQLVDERYTTKEAKQRLSTSKMKASLDAMSAVCLLERYIEDRGDGSIPAIPCSYPLSPQNEIFDYELVRKHIRSIYGYEKKQDNANILQEKIIQENSRKTIDTARQSDFTEKDSIKKIKSLTNRLLVRSIRSKKS